MQEAEQTALNQAKLYKNMYDEQIQQHDKDKEAAQKPIQVEKAVIAQIMAR